MSTALDLITRSLKSFNAIAASETLDSATAQDGLDALNGMIGQWNAESTMILGQTINTFNLVAGQQTYTYGSGAVDFNTTRPQAITEANLIITTVSPVLRIPVEIINYDQWASILVQTQPVNSYPSKLYWDTGFPTGNIYLWGPPVASLQLELYTWSPISKFAALITAFSLPPEYEEAIVYGLALRLAPMFDKELGQLSIQLALQSKANIQRLNAVTPLMASDLTSNTAPRGIYGFFSGY